MSDQFTSDGADVPVAPEAPAVASEAALVSTPDAAAVAAAPPVAVAPAAAPGLPPKVAALCAPLSEDDPSGPDLDLAGDADYLNFFAYLEVMLPTSFFSPEDGRPFDPATLDIDSQLAALEPLLKRSRDLRLLSAMARLMITRRDLSGFAVAVAAIAELLDTAWDSVHPLPQGDNIDARLAVVNALDLPTVVFPLQYVPLIEARGGLITYRAWMIAIGEAQSRGVEAIMPAAAMTEAIAAAPAAQIDRLREDLMLLGASLKRIQKSLTDRGRAGGLTTISALVAKMLAFVAPNAVVDAPAQAAETAAPLQATTGFEHVTPPGSMDEAAQALAAIARYYSRSEPSSPALPLVRQAHLLIGKSFLEVMQILMPSQVDKAAFQIGTDPVFDLPVEKLSAVSEVAPASFGQSGDGADGAMSSGPRYSVETRQQAIALLDAVQRYFRHSEPSSPVPMLCERARALVERDFMGVLRDVLPKSALKNLSGER